MASALVMSCFFRSLVSSNSANVSRYDAGRKWALRRDFVLLKPAGMQQFPPTAGARPAADDNSPCKACLKAYDHEKRNPAQCLRHELRRASVAGAVDPSARPHQRI